MYFSYFKVCFSYSGQLSGIVLVKVNYRQTDGSTRNEMLGVEINVLDSPIQCVHVIQGIMSSWWITRYKDVDPSGFFHVSHVKILPHRDSTGPLYIDNFYIGKQPLQCKEI